MVGRFGFGRGRRQGVGIRMRKRLVAFRDINRNFIEAMEKKGYKYIGMCRCGLGPNALWQDKDGRIIHTSDIINETKGDNQASQQ